MNSRELPFREIDGSSFLVPSKGPFGGFLSGAGDVVPRDEESRLGGGVGALLPGHVSAAGPEGREPKSLHPISNLRLPTECRLIFFFYASAIFKLPLSLSFC